MLQFGGTLRNSTVRISPMSSWRMPVHQLLAACSGAANCNPIIIPEKEDGKTHPVNKPIRPNNITITSMNPMVQAAFNSLKRVKIAPESKNENDSIVTDDKIIANVNGLLDTVNEQKVMPTTALATITLLLNWVNKGKAKLSDFETDPRFLTLCKIWLQTENSTTLGSQVKTKPAIHTPFNPYNFFYESTGIDEIVKVDSTITANQMVQMMMALAQQKRRTTPLLKSLCVHIYQSSERLGVKQMVDLLYAMASLNYVDQALFEKLCNDLRPAVELISTSSLIGSILTSLTATRYKDQNLLNELSVWTVNNVHAMRSIDVCRLFRTLAMAGYTPANIENLTEVVIKPLNERDMARSSHWLNFVWALTVLGLVQNRHMSSVLNSNFIRKFNDITERSRMPRYKLLNINGAARLLMKNYEGPFLESDSDIGRSTIIPSKAKQEYAKSVIEVLEHDFPQPKFLQPNVNLGIGMLVDAEICIDTDGQRLPIDTEFNDSCRGSRIAMFFTTYNDYCRGTVDVLGYHTLYRRMLEVKGYTVIYIPMSEFTRRDTISHRINYVNTLIKSVVD